RPRRRARLRRSRPARPRAGSRHRRWRACARAGGARALCPPRPALAAPPGHGRRVPGGRSAGLAALGARPGGPRPCRGGGGAARRGGGAGGRMRPGPLVIAGLLAIFLVVRWRRLQAENRVIGVLAVAALAVYGTGLVHPPSLDKILTDVGEALGPYTYALVGA